MAYHNILSLVCMLALLANTACQQAGLDYSHYEFDLSTWKDTAELGG